VLNLPYTFIWRPRSARIFLYLSKLATQMVTSTPLENLSLLLYEPQNKIFIFGTSKTLILHARWIFFRGGHMTKIWSKKIFFMKTLSKLGALTVYIDFILLWVSHKSVQYWVAVSSHLSSVSISYLYFPHEWLSWVPFEGRFRWVLAGEKSPSRPVLAESAVFLPSFFWEMVTEYFSSNIRILGSKNTESIIYSKILKTIHFVQLQGAFLYIFCSTTGKPTRSFATERVSLDSV
jgi:hypothetical protein